MVHADQERRIPTRQKARDGVLPKNAVFARQLSLYCDPQEVHRKQHTRPEANILWCHIVVECVSLHN